MIYLDNNATTQIDDPVVEVMQPYLTTQFANPSSPYTFARPAALAIDRARSQIAAAISAPPSSIIFTSGGTESNHLAILGALPPHPSPGPRDTVLFTPFEHPSVARLKPILQARGYQTIDLPLLPDGRLDLHQLQTLCTPRTALVCAMLANNETGILYPLPEISAIAHRAGALVHCDAVQTLGKIPLQAQPLGPDFISLCAHKLHGPKGTGALYLRTPRNFTPPNAGGDQEFALRPGTENVPGIAGFGLAAERAIAHGLPAMPPLALARDSFEQTLLQNLDGIHIVGHHQPRLPNTSLLAIDRVETEPLLIRLDQQGICASSGSACSSGAHEPSPGLRALGFDQPGQAILRISASRFNTPDHFTAAAHALIQAITRLRS
ncbi:MAG TPA: cysteine desulfurase family protein [Kiritimatiellia bacterium]|nr:cysteine desulfurase family protein [Kiritimatiellia bacterium]